MEQKLEVGKLVKIKEIEEVCHSNDGGVMWYDDSTDELVLDKRFGKETTAFGKTMVVVAIEDKMYPRNIAVCSNNRKNDWKYWYWIPENYINQII